MSIWLRFFWFNNWTQQNHKSLLKKIWQNNSSPVIEHIFWSKQLQFQTSISKFYKLKLETAAVGVNLHNYKIISKKNSRNEWILYGSRSKKIEVEHLLYPKKQGTNEFSTKAAAKMQQKKPFIIIYLFYYMFIICLFVYFIIKSRLNWDCNKCINNCTNNREQKNNKILQNISEKTLH